MPDGKERSIPRRVLLKTGAAVTAGTAFAGCLGDDTDDEPAADGDMDGGTLTIGTPEPPTDFDPIRQADGTAAPIHHRIFSVLYTFDEGTNIIPHVAESMPEISREGTRWVVPIVDHAEWHNGDPLTAEDVIYSTTQPVEEQRENMDDYSVIDEATEIDEHTVQFDLSEPEAIFQSNLVTTLAPKDVREEHKDPRPEDSPTGGGWNENIVGSGPFELAEWESGGVTRLERVEDHWFKTANIEEIVFEPIEEGTTRVTELQTQEIDMVEEVPPELIETVRDIDHADTRETSALSYNYLAYNQNEGETQKLEVREGINHCFSVGDVIDRFVGETGEPAWATLPRPVSESLDLPLDKYRDLIPERDIDRAAELFEEAGVPDDWEPTIMTGTGEVNENIATDIVNGINEAGYNAEVQTYEFGTFLERYNTGNSDYYSAYIVGWSGAVHPMVYLYNLFHENHFGTFIGTFYEDQELFDLIIDGLRSAEPMEEMTDVYDEIITIVLENHVHTPLHSPIDTWGVHDDVRDWEPHPRGAFINPRFVTDYQHTWLDR